MPKVWQRSRSRSCLCSKYFEKWLSKLLIVNLFKIDWLFCAIFTLRENMRAKVYLGIAIENLKLDKMLKPLDQAWQSGIGLALGRTDVNKYRLCGPLLT